MSASTSRPRAVFSIPPPPPIDPLDVFVSLEHRLFTSRERSGEDESSGGARTYFVPPIIDTNRDTMPGLYRFAERTNTGHLADEHVAALFVCIRLFGDAWRDYAPAVRNKQWIASLEEFRRRNARGPCAAELLEISRVFRVFLRPDDATLARHRVHLAAFIEHSRQFSGEAFNSTRKADSYRVALFLYALRASEMVDDRTKDRFLSFVRQNSFIRRKDAASLREMIDASHRVDRESIRLAIRSFRLKACK